jgi:hypothetical protein
MRKGNDWPIKLLKIKSNHLMLVHMLLIDYSNKA